MKSLKSALKELYRCNVWLPCLGAFLVSIHLAAPAYSIVLEKKDSQDASQKGDSTAANYVSGEVLVKFKKGVSKVDKKKYHSDVEAEVISEIPDIDVEKVKSKTGETTEALIEKYRKNPNVEYAEPNGIVRIRLTPNDPRFPELWGLHNIGQTGGANDADIDAPEAWDLQTGSSSIVVAGIDTGVDYNHEDLSANMWTNPGEIPGNGRDDDHNGFVDDVHGWDFANNDNDPMDDQGHGTHTAGTIAAAGNNGIGVTGINWQSRIMPVKFISYMGIGTFDGAANAILYASEMGAKVSNNSWGCGPSAECFSQVIEDALNVANERGMLFVVAAGNSWRNNDTVTDYPCISTVPNVLCVAATDHNDEKASWSSYGPSTVDLGAPGVDILSTVPTGTCDLCDPSGYTLLSGTSMATPHVAGAAALVLTQMPFLNPNQLKGVLMGSVDPIPDLSGKTVTGGRLNVNNAFGVNFVITGTPESQRISRVGRSVSYTITVTSLGSFSAPVTLSMTTSDPSITGSFSVNPITPPANGSVTSTLTVATTVATTAGTHPLTIYGADNMGHKYPISLILQMDVPDFSISVSPALQSILPGESTAYTVTLNSINRYNTPVTLSLTTADPNISGTFSPNPATPSSTGPVTSTLNVATTSSVSPGDHTLTIEGTDGVKTRTSKSTLHVIDVDLVITGISGPASGTVGSNINTSITVCNTGTTDMEWAMNEIRLYMSKDATIGNSDDVLFGRGYVTGLAGGTCTTNTSMPVLTIPGIMAGTYYLGAVVDPTNVVRETNNANNIFVGGTIAITSPYPWVGRYDGGSGDMPVAVAVDASGNVYVTGSSAGSSGIGIDYSTVKYDPAGNMVWAARYDSGYGDIPVAVAVDASGNVYVTGTESWYITPTTYSDFATVKYDSAGNQVWVARYDRWDNDDAVAMALDASGNVYVTGTSNNDYATVKYDPAGNQVWVSRYDNGYIDNAVAVAVDAAGNVYVTGSSGTAVGGDYATVKYTPAGKEAWVSRYGSGGPSALAVDVSGNVYVTGSSWNGGSWDYATVKYDPAGNQVWVSRYDNGYNDDAAAVAVDVSGNVYVTGRSFKSNLLSDDYLTVKYDHNGAQVWTARYDTGDSESEYAVAVAVDASGNVYATGYSINGGGGWDYITVKYNSAGAQIWTARYSNGYSDVPVAMTMDASGNIYVTGYSWNTVDTDYATVKYGQ